jgi:hypothetical protein
LILLAVDPGCIKSAYVLYETQTGTILGKDIVQNDIAIKLFSELNHEKLVIEMIQSFGMPVGKEVFETCVWIGRFKQAAIECGINPELVYRKDVKMHLCGNTRAKDANIRQALIDLLGKDKTKGVSKDMWAALGVAVTVAGVQ